MTVARRTESMIEAWFSSSEISMSPGSQSVGKIASLAFQHETNVYADSVPMYFAMVCSSCSWGVNEPQMKRTLAVPAPKSRRPFRPASTTSG